MLAPNKVKAGAEVNEAAWHMVPRDPCSSSLLSFCRVLIKVTEFPVCSLASSGLPNKAQTHHFLFVWTRVGEMHQSCQLSTMDLAVAQPRRGAPEK